MMLQPVLEVAVEPSEGRGKMVFFQYIFHVAKRSPIQNLLSRGMASALSHYGTSFNHYIRRVRKAQLPAFLHHYPNSRIRLRISVDLIT